MKRLSQLTPKNNNNRQSRLTRSSRNVLSATGLFLFAIFSGSALTAQQSAAPTLVASTGTTGIADGSSSSLSTADSTGDADALPQTPQPPAQKQPDDHTDGQTRRILGIVPNFRAVSANAVLPPQSVKEKFVTASEDSFDYSSIVLPAVVAGIDLERNSTPEFGHGGVGYGRYLWHVTVDQTVENYMVEFVVPAATHEDIRYYTLGHGGFLKRSGYALSRVVITRSDSGSEVFNAGEIIGAGAAAGISNLYYPSRERGLGNTGSQWGLNVGIDAATFVVKEFWPDINHALFHGSKPFHDANQPH